MIQPVPAPVYKQTADQNGMEAWKQHYKPIPIGGRLIILPVWLDSPSPERIPIKIDPGMAFGTGTHPTTQLCLELIELFFESQSSTLAPHASAGVVNHKSEIIDIGCGSVILSIASLKL